MAKDNNENYEGRLRMLEAVIRAMPNAKKLIEAARRQVRDEKRGRDKQLADAMHRLSGHSDRQAEEALDKLAGRLG
jgi:hypothetical protein